MRIFRTTPGMTREQRITGALAAIDKMFDDIVRKHETDLLVRGTDVDVVDAIVAETRIEMEQKREDVAAWLTGLA